MASITIRDVDPEVKRRLRLRAARYGRSMEAEVREILKRASLEPSEREGNLGTQIHALFADIGGVELDIPPREPTPPPIKFRK